MAIGSAVKLKFTVDTQAFAAFFANLDGVECGMVNAFHKFSSTSFGSNGYV